MINVTVIRISALTLMVTLALLLVLRAEANYLSSFDDVTIVGTPTLSGFEGVKTGVFRSVKAQNEFHSYNLPISLVPNIYYRVRYEISELPSGKVIVTADLYASGYDNPEQELTKVLGMNALGKRQDFILNSGDSPAHAHFRLFYSGPPGLEIANVQITQVAAWSIWLKRVLLTGALGALLVLIWASIRRVRNISTLSRPIAAGKSRLVAAEIPAVMTIYLAAVLIRFSMYIVMPYWSGDEYVYKSIAAGIWHFGHHGFLTYSMISHSVELPNLLYPYLISPAFALGENFYIGVRLINAIVINMAIFPSYLIARKYLAQTSALAAASLCIAIPFINIGAFAVTEVLFFPLFLLSVWIAIESIGRKYSIGWALAFGLVAAILLNVRLNAMVMVPAYLFSLLWITLRQQQALTLLTRPYWLVTVISFFGTYVALKYLLDGRSIGEFGIYAGIAERTEGPLSIIANNPVGIFRLIAGHLTTLSVPYALPIALMIFSVVTNRRQLTNDNKFDDFLIVVSVFTLALISLAIIFTIGVSPFDLGGLGRWHSRYYFHSYPLVIIAVLGFADRLQPTPAIHRFGAIAVVVFLLACNFYFIKIFDVLQFPWFGSIADNMDVQWYRSAGQFYWLFIAFTLVLTWLWYWRSIYFMRCLVSFMFTWVIVANYGTMQYAGVGRGVQQAGVELQDATELTLSASCGALAANFLDHNPGRFVIVGDSASTMVNAAFWNPYIPEKTIVYNGGSKLLSADDVGIGANYLIVNGLVSVDAAYRPLLSIGKCSIYEIPN